ncbi:RHS repeat domain-containing protein [Chryseobacterium jejuense]|uniref:RHS repeat domain-containing protein n=1 Tax=Chryseobacterium jejuense TaxID=445960 RepID=UPI001AE2338B|nr:RHS repeat-associated core domain-containing protein [Chryseobacterium jejuense]MBP2619727.1 RHS repeat-associated protein [Chryseobacterium jejuense]
MIQEESNYYPFGLKHEGYNSSSLLTEFGTNYKYKFLGQELQENGFYDLGARFYVPELGIFGQHDPLSGKTLDPYGYAYQNPIFFTDPTGLEGDPIPGGSGPGNPQSIGTATSPIDVGEIVLNAPIRAMATSSNLPSCSYCYTGAGVKGGLQGMGILPRPLSDEEILRIIKKPVLHNGSAQMMDSVWDILGILAANAEPENREAALGLAAIAIITSGGRAAPGIIKAESSIVKTEIKTLSRAEMSNIWGAGPLRIDPKNLPKTVTNDFTEILAGRGVPRLDDFGLPRTVQRNSKWNGALEWQIKDVPGTVGLNSSRIVQHPDGKWGLVINHDYNKIIQIPTSSAVKWK